MIKQIILIYLLSLSTFLNADYLMTITMTDTKEDYTFSRCIKSYFTSDSNLYYVKSYDNTTYLKSFSNIKNYSIKSGFILLDNGACEKFTGTFADIDLDSTLVLNADNLTYLGLSDSDLNLSFALSGILLSSLFLFGIGRFL